MELSSKIIRGSTYGESTVTECNVVFLDILVRKSDEIWHKKLEGFTVTYCKAANIVLGKVYPKEMLVSTAIKSN